MLQVVTDSSAGISPDLLESNHIEVVPLNVHFGTVAYREGVDLDLETFYRLLSQAERLPTTSQPSIGQFEEVYRRLTAAGDSVVSIHLSSKLSGTYQSAAAAKAMLPEKDITVVDSLSVSMGHGMVVLAAAEAVREGKGRDEVLARIDRVIKGLQVIFIVDSLEYLQKGGRIGGAAAFVGTLLSLKPLLEVRDGRVEPLERVRNRRRALERTLRILEERLSGQGRLRMVVLHAQCPDEAESLSRSLKALFDGPEPMVAELGPVVGIHGGPGTLGVGAYAESLIR